MNEVPRRLRRLQNKGTTIQKEKPVQEKGKPGIFSSLGTAVGSMFTKKTERVLPKIQNDNKELEIQHIMQNIKTVLSESKDKNTPSHRTLEEIRSFKRKKSRYPESDEYDAIAESVFKQLQKDTGEEMEKERAAKRKAREEARKKEREQAKEARKEKHKPAQAEKKTVQKKAIKTEEDFEPVASEGNLTDKIKGMLNEDAESDVGNLNIENEDGDFSLSELKDVDAVDAKMETRENACPTCKTKTEEIVFCPSCGSGFCNHCAKAVKQVGDRIQYTCPKCKTAFKTRKL